MSGPLSAANISTADFDAILGRYETTVPSKLHELDELRFEKVPALLKSRREGKNGIWLEKNELEQLVDWKLKHGTYRPSLAKLVASNSDKEVESSSRSAFSISPEPPRKMLDQLTKLRGVGPATASLIASCYDPDNLPFFSDELFRWLHWDGKNYEGSNVGIKQAGKGWSRQIGYTAKEYESLRIRCGKVQKRLSDAGREITSLEMEKVAFVLGKEGADVDSAGVDKADAPLAAMEKRSKRIREPADTEHTEQDSKKRKAAAVRKDTASKKSVKGKKSLRGD